MTEELQAPTSQGIIPKPGDAIATPQATGNEVNKVKEKGSEALPDSRHVSRRIPMRHGCTWMYARKGPADVVNFVFLAADFFGSQEHPSGPETRIRRWDAQDPKKSQRGHKTR